MKKLTLSILMLFPQLAFACAGDGIVWPIFFGAGSPFFAASLGFLVWAIIRYKAQSRMTKLGYLFLFISFFCAFLGWSVGTYVNWLLFCG